MLSMESIVRVHCPNILNMQGWVRGGTSSKSYPNVITIPSHRIIAYSINMSISVGDIHSNKNRSGLEILSLVRPHEPANSPWARGVLFTPE